MDANVEVQAGEKKYRFEEHDDYIVVLEVSESRSTSNGGSPTTNAASQTYDINAGKKEYIKSIEGSLDSGYESKIIACSPGAKVDVMTRLETEGWCVLKEDDKCRPNGLYGYRFMDYDDQEAEGNIHITDEDL